MTSSANTAGVLKPGVEEPFWRRLAQPLYYAGLVVVVFLLASTLHKTFLPEGLATQIGHNSEAFFFTLLLSLWIQFGLSHLHGSRRYLVAVLVAASMFAGSWALLASDLQSSVRTLNESLTAAGILVLYTSIPRPLPRPVVWASTVGITVVLAIGAWLARPTATNPDGQVNVVTQQVEAGSIVLLAIIALDAVDRGILDPEGRTRTWLRWCFYALMLVLPAVAIAAGLEGRQGSDPISVGLDVLGRSIESFIGVLLICLYFAVVLGRTGRPYGRSVGGPSPSSARS